MLWPGLPRRLECWVQQNFLSATDVPAQKMATDGPAGGRVKLGISE